MVEPEGQGWQIGVMVQGGDRGFLFRVAGLGILIMAGWKILEAGGVLGAGEQLLPNREIMAQWAPMVLVGMFFLRGPMPARKSVARVAGFQFLNLGFLALATLYGLAAVPLGVDFSGVQPIESFGEADWGVRDRLKEVENRMSQIDRESAEGPVNTDGWSESKKREMENRKQERMQQMEQCRQERSRLMEELDRRAKAWAERSEREKGSLRSRLQKAQTFCGLSSAILLLLGIHGLVAGFLSSGSAISSGGFPVVSASGGKVENSIPGALRPKRPAS
ncbi:hypothetical protein EBX31_00585 [bacterium]|nr:hypothetical protein [bacterium]